VKIQFFSVSLIIRFVVCPLQFYVEEEKGTVDYQGYILPRRRGGDLVRLCIQQYISFYVDNFFSLMRLKHWLLFNFVVDLCSRTRNHNFSQSNSTGMVCERTKVVS
jgi:hypothetical protein